MTIPSAICPRCKVEVAEDDLLNKSGKRTWCSTCRAARVDGLRALGNKGKRVAPLVEVASEGGPLRRLVEAAAQMGAWKIKAQLVPKGARRQQAWAAHFRARRVVEALMKELNQRIE